MAKKPAKAQAVVKKMAVKPLPKSKVKFAPIAVASAEPPDTSAVVLDRLWAVILDRRNADPALSHSARLLSRGTAKVAQKFGEEAVECLIEAVAGNPALVVSESADVLYHLLVLWVASGVKPGAVWAELERREGVSGIAEKAARALPRSLGLATRKIP
ncbi:phosphoribosyl-ATP diphosphatase [Acidisphaera sp. L21]|uniref:phosphoribosyl-ATP diphosphatase n=1 Tax=Acidisphaera sp. L21 TaxID=1641851 RepID=UPI00131DDB42|nr:phosphoribosyl-ATP diphosphatase [Acidisphaera sp. L21]